MLIMQNQMLTMQVIALLQFFYFSVHAVLMVQVWKINCSKPRGISLFFLDDSGLEENTTVEADKNATYLNSKVRLRKKYTKKEFIVTLFNYFGKQKLFALHHQIMLWQSFCYRESVLSLKPGNIVIVSNLHVIVESVYIIVLFC